MLAYDIKNLHNHKIQFVTLISNASGVIHSVQFHNWRKLQTVMYTETVS